MSDGMWSDPYEEMNEGQRKLVDSVEGLIAVDAGPGTGKTTTITRRYIRMLENPEMMPEDILMLTFTENAAKEMEGRIKTALNDRDRYEDPNWTRRGLSKKVRAGTIDALCLSIVMDSADSIGGYFGLKNTNLSRSARIVANNTMNEDYFVRFLDSFVNTYCLSSDKYRNIACVAQSDPVTLFSIIQRLMSKGIIPIDDGDEDWLGLDWKDVLYGTLNRQMLEDCNESTSKAKSELLKKYEKIKGSLFNPLPVIESKRLADHELDRILQDEGRDDFISFVHDLYLEYIRQSIRDNRLSFGLTSMFAFMSLCRNPAIREKYRCGHIMVDEFQDTNSMQLMMILMLLDKPNLCVVGDWKQGIYSFRFADIENITRIEAKLSSYKSYLNKMQDAVAVDVSPVGRIDMAINYRSSKVIIETAFKALTARGSKESSMAIPPGVVVNLEQGKEHISDYSEVRFIHPTKRDDEADEVVKAIRDYITDPKYEICEGPDSRRRVRLGDIAILCRKNNHCRALMERMQKEGIPAYLQGDRDVMSTREGKLALAWLRFISNDNDQWGYVPILADMVDEGKTVYTLSEMMKMRPSPADGSGYIPLPSSLMELRKELRGKRLRITELLSCIFDLYGLDNDITQSIIATVSSVHNGSMLTISDVITMMERDIKEGTFYPVENSIDSDAVRIMSMHQAKGLEFPIVIIPYVDRYTVPNTSHDRGSFKFTEIAGLRMTNIVETIKTDAGVEYSKICANWMARLANAPSKTDYDEERRILFVALSRAQQYETIIGCRDLESAMMVDISDGNSDTISLWPEGDSEGFDASSVMPEFKFAVGSGTARSVHDFMTFNDDEIVIGGKGKDYGNEVHKVAQDLFFNRDVDFDQYPEAYNIQEFLESTEGCISKYSEEKCWLPVPGTDVTLDGVIDVLVEYEDHIEVHDYKTDRSRRNEDEYRFQLSIYARSVEQCLNKPAKCFIRYVSENPEQIVEFSPLTMDEIATRIRDYAAVKIE